MSAVFDRSTMPVDVAEWIGTAKAKIKANDNIIAWSKDENAREYQWEMTKKAGREAEENNKFLRQGLSIVERKYF